MRTRLFALGLTLPLLATACRAPAARARAIPGDAAAAAQHARGAAERESDQRLELYFGMNSPDGRGVSEQAWQNFLADTLVPTLGGLTVLEARGVWPDERTNLPVFEPTRVVVCLVPAADVARVAHEAHAIATAYKTRFAQQAVLLVWSAARMELP